MLSTDEFKAWAKNYVLFCHVTTRIEGRQNEDLLMRKGGRGFPYVVAMNEEGDVIAKLGARSVEGFSEMMDEADKYLTLKNKEERTSTEEAELLVLDLKLGLVSAADAKEEAEELGLDGNDAAMVKSALLDAEINETLGGIRSRDQQVEVAKKFYEMMKQGKKPTGKQVGSRFFPMVMGHAKSVGDADTFAKGLAEIERLFKGDDRAKNFIELQKKELEKLRAAEEADDGMGG